jgi:hypothetical protein
MEGHALAPASALGALAEAGRLDHPMAEVIAAEALVDPAHLLDAQARRYGASVVRRDTHPPDPDCITVLPARFCLEHAVLPWRRIGDVLLLATARPGEFDRLQLPADIGPVVMAITAEQDIHDILGALSGKALVQAAETQRRHEDSCRNLNAARTTKWRAGLGLAVAAGALLILEPRLFFALGLALA